MPADKLYLKNKFISALQLSNELSNGPSENFSTSPSPTQSGQDETNQTSGENSSENKSGIELVITLNKNENKNEQDGMLNDQPAANQSNELSNGPSENFSTSPSPTQSGQDETNQTSGENSSENKSGIELVITLNKNENKNEQDGMLNDQPAANQSTSTDYPLYHRPWLNEQSNNSLSDSRIENSRSLASTDNNRRTLTNDSDQQSKSSWWSNESENENGTYTIQLLPRRLSSMLQQAEQYARATISSVASTIIGGNKDETEPPKRRAKFFPPFSSLFGYGEVKQETITEKPTISRQDTGFSPMQVIKSQEWRISRYIPLRRYAARIETNNKPQEQQKDEQYINNKSDALITDSKPTIMGPR
ncbi:hypothetical protein B566_EDAN009451 [Ephemera danica]|nr:hypothetical protein B566_EDAN009451 [Ephemera danica]